MGDAATEVWIEAEDLAAVFAAGPVILLDATLPECLPLFGLGARVLRLQAVPDGLLLRPVGAGQAPPEPVPADQAPADRASSDQASSDRAAPGPARRPPPRPLRQVPGDVLAAVLRDQPTARRLIAWWQAVGGAEAVPPVVVAESGLAALPVLLRHALAEARGLAARCAELELALAAVREDGEDARVALREVSRTLGQRPPAPLVPALREAVAPGKAIPLAPGASLRQDLPLPVQGIAALALHLAAPWPQGRLRVRLRSAATGRVFGAWTVPAAALVPGWLRLDLPAPAGPVAEDALLELSAEAADPGADPRADPRADPGGGALLLSPAEASGPAEAPGSAAAAGPAPPRAALMVWTSRPGGRFAAAPHFDWAAWDGEAPPPGTPLLPAPDLLAGARLAGPLQLVPRQGPDATRAGLVLAAGWQEATLLLPGLALEPGEAVRLELRGRSGDLRGATAALSLLPADPGATLAELQASALGRTGWRVLDTEAATTLALAAPAGPPLRATLALSLRTEWPDAGRDTEIDLAGIRLLRPGPGDAPARREASAAPLLAPPMMLEEYPLALPPGALAGVGTDAAPPSPLPGPHRPGHAHSHAQGQAGGGAGPAPAGAAMQAPGVSAGGDRGPAAPAGHGAGEAGAGFDGAQLDDHLAGDGYELIDLQISGLAAGGLTWPRLKFKLSVSDGAVTLEFRGGPDVPRMFEEWPGTAEDDYGPVHHVVAEAGRLFGHDRFRTPRDRALLAGLLEVLPGAVAKAIGLARRPEVDAEAWAGAARAFVQRMRAGS